MTSELFKEITHPPNLNSFLVFFVSFNIVLSLSPLSLPEKTGSSVVVC